MPWLSPFCSALEQCSVLVQSKEVLTRWRQRCRQNFELPHQKYRGGCHDAFLIYGAPKFISKMTSSWPSQGWFLGKMGIFSKVWIFQNSFCHMLVTSEKTMVGGLDALLIYGAQKVYSPTVSTIGLTLWNLSCLEFKFDDTRLSYWHKNKIGRIDFFCCILTLLNFCRVGLLSFAETANRAEN